MAVPLLTVEGRRGLVGRFQRRKRKLEEGGDGEHGARNIKRGMKGTAVTYATRKSSSEMLLHPSLHLGNSASLLHFNDGTGISRRQRCFCVGTI